MADSKLIAQTQAFKAAVEAIRKDVISMDLFGSTMEVPKVLTKSDVPQSLKTALIAAKSDQEITNEQEPAKKMDLFLRKIQPAIGNGDSEITRDELLALKIFTEDQINNMLSQANPGTETKSEAKKATDDAQVKEKPITPQNATERQALAAAELAELQLKQAKEKEAKEKEEAEKSNTFMGAVGKIFSGDLFGGLMALMSMGKEKIMVGLAEVMGKFDELKSMIGFSDSAVAENNKTATDTAAASAGRETTATTTLSDLGTLSAPAATAIKPAEKTNQI